MTSKVFAFLLLAMVATITTTTAFTTGPNTNRRAKIVGRHVPTVADMPSYYGSASSSSSSSSSTSLNLKVKVDPNAKTDNSKGNAKAAAYGGSIAIAALLPIAFLVWSALSKGN